MNVFVYDPFVSKEIIEKFGGQKVENLTEATKKMDAISVHVPLNKDTEGLINYELLKTMKKNCIIINAARGGIINEIDLNKALNFFEKKLYPKSKIKELIAINKNKVQNPSFRILSYKAVFQKSLSTKIGVYFCDYIDIHNKKDYINAKKIIEKKNYR